MNLFLCFSAHMEQIEMLQKQNTKLKLELEEKKVDFDRFKVSCPCTITYFN